MNVNFVKNRITKLRLEKDLSEREMSLSLGKAHNYIQSISSGKITPTIESLLDICDYLEVTPSSFFDENIDNPIVTNRIIDEAKRISKNNLDLFLKLLELFEPDDFYAYIRRLDEYKAKH